MPAFCVISRAHGSLSLQDRPASGPHEPSSSSRLRGKRGASRGNSDPRAQVQRRHGDDADPSGKDGGRKGGGAGQGRRGSGGGKGTRGPGRPLEIHLNRHPIFRFARHIVAAAAAAAAAAAVVVVRPASRYCVTLRDATGEEEIRRTISSNRLLLLSADHAGAPWSSSMSSRERY